MSPQVTGQRSLRFRIIVPLIVIGAVTVVSGGWYIRRDFTKLVNEQLNQRVQVIGNALAYAAEITGRSPQLGRIVNSLGAESDVLLIIVVSGNPARVIACTQNIWIGRPLAELKDLAERAQLERVMDDHSSSVRFDETSSSVEYNVPLHLSAGHDGTIAQAEGALHVVLDARPTRRVLSRSAWSQMIVLLSAIFTLTMTLAGPPLS